MPDASPSAHVTERSEIEDTVIEFLRDLLEDIFDCASGDPRTRFPELPKDLFDCASGDSRARFPEFNDDLFDYTADGTRTQTPGPLRALYESISSVGAWPGLNHYMGNDDNSDWGPRGNRPPTPPPAR